MPTQRGAAATSLFAQSSALERRGAARAAMLRAAAPAAPGQCLLFRIANRRLLAPVAQLTGVLQLPRLLTTVPGTARWVLGVANHRGLLLPIYDLRGLLLADYEGIQHRGLALIVPGGNGAFGLVVDEVIALRRSHWHEAPPPAAMMPEALAALVIGRCDGDGDGDALPVVDLARLERLPQLTAAAPAGSSPVVG